jgi:hypothetical protein
MHRDFDKGWPSTTAYLWSMGLFLLAMILFQSPLMPLGLLPAVAGTAIIVRDLTRASRETKEIEAKLGMGRRP